MPRQVEGILEAFVANFTGETRKVRLLMSLEVAQQCECAGAKVTSVHIFSLLVTDHVNLEVFCVKKRLSAYGA